MNGGWRGVCLGADLVLFTDGQQKNSPWNERQIGHEYLVGIKG